MDEKEKDKDRDVLHVLKRLLHILVLEVTAFVINKFVIASHCILENVVNFDVF